MTAPLLETRGLGMRFGGVHAVRDVDFTLAERELRCLIGPNGAGKSTFFKMLTGQLQPTAGAVLFRGERHLARRAAQIARLGIGIKTQVPSVFDGLSVRENIWLAARGRASRPARRARSSTRCWSGSASAPIADAHGRPARARPAAMGRARRGAVDRSDAHPARRAGRRHDRRGGAAAPPSWCARSTETKALIVVEHDMQFIRMIASKVTVFNQGAVLVEDDRREHHAQPAGARRLSRQAGGGMMLEVDRARRRLWPHPDPQAG